MAVNNKYNEAVMEIEFGNDDLPYSYFTQVFNEYVQFEAIDLDKRMDEGAYLPYPIEIDHIQVELRLAKVENLMKKRLLQINSGRLKKKPHDVQEWLMQVQLHEGNPNEIINTFTKAIQTVNPKLVEEELYFSLLIGCAKFYEKNKQLNQARFLFEKATAMPKKAETLATVWREFIQMEIRNNNFNNALELVFRSIDILNKKVIYNENTETIEACLYKSINNFFEKNYDRVKNIFTAGG